MQILFDAVRNGNIEKVRGALNEGANVNAQNRVNK